MCNYLVLLSVSPHLPDKGLARQIVEEHENLETVQESGGESHVGMTQF